ncbi:MAG: NAD(P)H-dependent glycerol-3-phosphate dehydrogenase [Rhodospirillales bacterium]
METIGILGAGAWGTALAATAARAGRRVVIQAHEAEVADAINRTHTNPFFLPDIPLDPAIGATDDPLQAVAGADAVLVAVPAQHVRGVLTQTAHVWRRGVPAVLCAKGVEHGTCALMSEVVESAVPQATVAVLSGPSFAVEVARELPTAVTLACADERAREILPQALGTTGFRIYSSDDVVGAELGGAVKNVLAIACGIVAGRGMGDNARAALITRGLAEMARLTVAMGGRPDTLMGLSGIGDLVLTCSALQSRNFSLGDALGRGERLADILASRTSVAEGVFSAAAVTEMARREGVSMPICFAVDAVLNAGADLDETIAGLLARPFRPEGWAD